MTRYFLTNTIAVATNGRFCKESARLAKRAYKDELIKFAYKRNYFQMKSHGRNPETIPNFYDIVAKKYIPYHIFENVFIGTLSVGGGIFLGLAVLGLL